LVRLGEEGEGERIDGTEAEGDRVLQHGATQRAQGDDMPPTPAPPEAAVITAMGVRAVGTLRIVDRKATGHGDDPLLE
jgi:hypothetical protein